MVKEVCRNRIWDERRMMEQGEHGGIMGPCKQSSGVRKVGWDC